MKTLIPSRLWIGITLFILIGFSSFTFAVSPSESAGWTHDDAAHLLRRAGFGGTPAEIDAVFALGRPSAVDYLITGKLPAGAEAPFAHVELKAFEMKDEGIDPRANAERLFELQKLRSWWIDRMVRSDRPLEEKMSLFWHGLFTSGIRECKVARWMVDQNLLFHQQAIGNYKTLTRDILHDPAMLKYLNNDENLKGKPNENLARELMELFTLGEGSGYTEKDIPEVARALTGMTPRPPRLGLRGSVMRPFLHDDGPKTIFGHTGNYGPDDVVNLIFARSEPADYLARKLLTFFQTPTPSDEEVQPIAQALRQSHWELAPALRVMFNSPAFYDAKAKLAIIKSPVELEAGTLHLLEEPTEARLMFAATNGAKQMGEELFQPPNVKGWPGGEHWITSSAIYTRYNIASAMANGTYGAFVGGGMGMLRGKENNKNNIGAGNVPEVNAPEKANGAARANAVDQVTSAPPLQPGTTGARKLNQQLINQQARLKIQQELAALPLLPPPGQMVAPAKLFPQIKGEATADNVVDAAIARFLQQPLPPDKRSVLTEALGTAPLSLGRPETDRRVRQMIGLLMSTPEYQVE
jgi:uncharacterized protein (DUF1800 family)